MSERGYSRQRGKRASWCAARASKIVEKICGRDGRANNEDDEDGRNLGTRRVKTK